MFDSNRRQFPRANYPCQLTMWMMDGSNETILANTSNIGLGGLCVHLNQDVILGTKADIIISFKSPTVPFSCQGKIVRCKKENEKFYSIGIQFDPLSKPQHSLLSAKISELLELEQKGQE